MGVIVLYMTRTAAVEVAGVTGLSGIRWRFCIWWRFWGMGEGVEQDFAGLT